jgi:hypothetical protein
MSSYVSGAKFIGHEHFKGEIPSIFKIQDMVEAAWDQGISSQSREETGGIKGTRKYIGTPEVSRAVGTVPPRHGGVDRQCLDRD